MKTLLSSDLESYVAGVKPEFEDKLSQLVAIPTVSADPKHQKDIQRGTKLAASFLEEAGLKATIVPTRGNPVVMGQYIAGTKYPTVTHYGHLDVQPVEPADWRTDPFKLIVKDDRYIGRGATDDKGPILSSLFAIRYVIARKLPLNINVLWELEEEINSPHFEEFLASQRAALSATDSVVLSDTIWTRTDLPVITYGLRGMTNFELRLRTARRDAHSGTVGGVARNPIAELAQVISECFDAKTGKVKIPGFYDDVQAPNAAEIESFIASGFSIKRFAEDLELELLRTYNDREAVTRIMTEPTFEVHGMIGGYTGPGIKNIIPPVATAKLSCRLVPNQDPTKIFKLVQQFVQKNYPDIEVIKVSDCYPYVEDFEGPYADAVRAAVKYAFGSEPAFVRLGGSIGAVISMKQQFKTPVIMPALSLPEQGYHAQNEYFDWRQASGGIKMYVHYFDAINRIPSKKKAT